MSVGTGRQNTKYYNSVLEITDSFLGIYEGNQTFILDSHQPFICSVGSKGAVKTMDK
jgi:hypothetical protein